MRIHRLAVVVLVASALVSAAGCDLLVSGPGGPAARAERRVRTMLEGMAAAGSRGAREADLTVAEAAWWSGAAHIPDPSVSSRASDLFRQWRAQKGLVYGGLGESEVVEVVAPESPGLPVEVAVRIDGRPLRMEVVESEPIRWAE